MPTKPGAWDVVSTAPAQNSDGWNVVSVTPSQASAPQQSGIGAFYEASGAKGLVDALHHSLNTASTVLDAGKRVFTPGQPGRMSDNPNPIIRGIGEQVEPFGRAVAQAWKQPSRENIRHVAQTVPIAAPALQQAQKYYDEGNTPAAVGTMLGTATGLFAPEALESAPRIISGATRGTGKFLQESGANRMDRFLNGGKRLPVNDFGRPEYDAPGRTVLEQGPSTSFATSRPRLTQQIGDARNAVGPTVSAAYNNSQARVPLPRLKDVVDGVIDPMRKIASGPGGNPNMGARFDRLRESFGPNIDLQGTTSPGSVHEGIRTLDKNINWNRGPDPLDATVRNASRQIRGGMRNVLNEYSPEGIEPSNRYRNLSDAMEFSADNHNATAWKGGLGRLSADAVAGMGTTLATGSPLYGAKAAVLTHILPPLYRLAPVQTGLATGLFQSGRLLESGGRLINGVTPLTDSIIDRSPRLLTRPSLIRPLTMSAPLQPPAKNGKGKRNNESDIDQSLYQSIAPRGGAISVLPPLRRLRSPYLGGE